MLVSIFRVWNHHFRFMESIHEVERVASLPGPRTSPDVVRQLAVPWGSRDSNVSTSSGLHAKHISDCGMFSSLCSVILTTT